MWRHRVWSPAGRGRGRGGAVLPSAATGVRGTGLSGVPCVPSVRGERCIVGLAFFSVVWVGLLVWGWLPLSASAPVSGKRCSAAVAARAGR